MEVESVNSVEETPKTKRGKSSVKESIDDEPSGEVSTDVKKRKR